MVYLAPSIELGEDQTCPHVEACKCPMASMPEPLA